MSKLSLSAYENETHVTYNDEESEAGVYTCNRALIRRMDGLVASGQAVFVRQDEVSKTYKVPKKFVKILPTRKSNMTDEQKRIHGDRLRELRKINSTGKCQSE